MAYALGLITYILVTTVVIVGFIKTSLSLMLSDGPFNWTLLISDQLIAITILYGFLLYRVSPRIYRRITDRTPLLPPRFLWESGYTVKIGHILIWFGLITFVSSIALGIYLASQSTPGIPIGIATGISILILSIGILMIETMLLIWQQEQRSKAR